MRADARIFIQNTDGRIYVFGSREDRLEIIATRRAFSRERLEAIKVVVTIDGDVAMVDTKYPPPSSVSLFADRSGTVDYVIFAPQSCTLAQVELEKGEIMIEGMRGPRVEARLGKGLFWLNNCFSAMRVSLGEGRMNVRYGWWEPGRFSLMAEVARGDLGVAVPVGAAMHFDAVSAKGKIVNDFYPETTGLSRIEEQYGGESAVEFQLRTTDGNIKLRRAY